MVQPCQSLSARLQGMMLFDKVPHEMALLALQLRAVLKVS
jgi:hypothetical protein